MPKFTFTPFPLEAPSTSSSEVEVKFRILEREIRELKGEVVEVKCLMTAMLEANSQMLAILKKMGPADTKLLHKFPLTSIEQLKEVDSQITGNELKYIPLFKTLLEDNLPKNFSRILSPSLMELNYGGTSDREGFASYIHLNETLFESQRRDGYRY
ncbi:hypothetical protein M5D96_012671 [Drosophila gunungcola]|uniref:DUF4806 domain-containing protein n=1 Tax=Drosophila gunungcola TaxID=103775 RepID=A0A9P9YCT7_9MUSC|nr:hypothetical protein M5D96_012671 [Drosophila gunungcola]